MYGKPCRHTLLYGNLKSTVFRLCWSVTCASLPNRIGRSQTYNVMHCWRQASSAGAPRFECGFTISARMEDRAEVICQPNLKRCLQTQNEVGFEVGNRLRFG